MGDGRRRTVEWEPRSAAELTTRRRRVKPVDWADIPLPQIVFAVAMVVMPFLIFVDSPRSAGVRILVSVGFFLLFAAGFMSSRQGIYLAKGGVTVQRGVLPCDPIPWEEVARFDLVRRRIPLGLRERQVVVLATVQGEVVPSWLLQRDPDFESHRLPVESAKAYLRSFPDLVDQLNRITAEVRADG